MNEQRQMLVDMVGGLFGEIGAGADLARDWPQINAIELTGLLVPEEEGGFGGSWEDAAAIFRLVGHHALDLPIVEAIIARHLAVRVGWLAPEGFGTIAAASEGTVRDGRFSGAAIGVPWGRHAAYLAIPSPDHRGVCLLAAGTSAVDQAMNPAGEPRDVLHLNDQPVATIEVDLFSLGAFARAAQIAGALDAALAMSVAYVNDRQQFGRPIAKFQAVQQALASFACEAVAANTAAFGAAQALERGEAGFEVAAAKLRANMAVGEGTAIAHQVHGAIGFTQEYALHPLTRRLWSWRSEFGGDAHWSAHLGGWAAARGADGFWPAISDRTDPQEKQ